MYLIAQCRYAFDIPIKTQHSHLTDVWHLNKAHWLTLCGVKVGEIRKKTKNLVDFDLHRFGSIHKVLITQDESQTTVNMGNSKLVFVIEPLDEKSHYLNVALHSTHKSLVWLWPLIQIVFWLTAIEDYIYYGNK